MKKLFLSLSVYLTSFLGFAQEQDTPLLNWVNANSIDLQNGDTYLEILLNEMKDRSLLGLGESTHGTKEFFTEKNRIINYLIKKGNYQTIGFEFTNSYIQPVNRFIQSGEGDLKALMSDFRLYNTQEFFDLFTSLKDHNSNLPEDQKVHVFGFDDNYFYPDRDSLMARNVLNKLKETKGKIIIWGHDVHFAKDKTAGFEAMGGFLHKKLSDQYYNVAFDTFQGSVNNIAFESGQWTTNSHTLVKPENNFSSLFSKSKYPRFFINITPLDVFYGKIDNKTHIFSDRREPYEIPTALGKDFNAIIFFRETSASSML